MSGEEIKHVGAGGAGFEVKADKAEDGRKFLSGAGKSVGRGLKGIAKLPVKAFNALKDMSSTQVAAEKHPTRTVLWGGVHVAVGSGISAIGIAIGGGSGAIGPALSPVITPIGAAAVTVGGIALGTVLSGIGGLMLGRGVLIAKTAMDASIRNRDMDPEARQTLAEMKENFNGMAKEAIMLATYHKKESAKKKSAEGNLVVNRFKTNAARIKELKTEMKLAKDINEAVQVQKKLRQVIKPSSGQTANHNVYSSLFNRLNAAIGDEFQI